MKKKQYSFLLICALLFSIIAFSLFYKITTEPFETIVTDFVSNNTGFYAMFFKVLNHYLYCKGNRKNFKIDSNGWVFQVKDGWADYFKKIDLKYNNTDDKESVTYTNSPSLQEFTIGEYKNAIPDLYVYNQKTINEISRRKSEANMFDNYDAIFVRRGDKLANESRYIKTTDYIELLLKKNPRCKNIFLQTDDYNCFIDLQNYIADKNLDINIKTLCDEKSVGAIMHSYRKDELSKAVNENNDENNKEYLSKIIDKLNSTKAVEEMTPEEKYDHVLVMLTGIDIVLNSNICITDYQSNVSRFIKLAHKKYENVFDITEIDVDLNKKKCPALADSFYNNHDEWFHSYP